MGSLARMCRTERFMDAFAEHIKKLQGVLKPGKVYTFKHYALTPGEHGEDVFIASVFEDEEGNEVVCQSLEFGCVYDPEWMDTGDLVESLATFLEMDVGQVEAILESVDLL